MKNAEDALWGSASTESKTRVSRVDITVEVPDAYRKKIKQDQPFEVITEDRAGPARRPKHRVRPRRDSACHPYVSFPLQPESKEVRADMETKATLAGVGFTLTVTFPKDQRQDVEAALWAWETFGGLGARTRRGFGALQCLSITEDGRDLPVELPPCEPQAARQWIVSRLKQYVQGDRWPAGVPHLSPNMGLCITGPTNLGQNPAVEAWRYLIDRLKAFRQMRKGGGSGRPGRSEWPEPDAIRQIYRIHSGAGGVPVRSSSPPGKHVFPRAQFGLPIIFHFKDEDLPDVELKGKQHDRLASRLILRPLMCQNGRALGLAAVLEGPGRPPGGLVLKLKEEYIEVSDVVAPEQAAQIPPLNGQPDVLRRFLQFLNESMRKER
jgi:CRISPR-associated protein Cmr1